MTLLCYVTATVTLTWCSHDRPCSQRHCLPCHVLYHLDKWSIAPHADGQNGFVTCLFLMWVLNHVANSYALVSTFIKIMLLGRYFVNIACSVFCFSHCLQLKLFTSLQVPIFISRCCPAWLHAQPALSTGTHGLRNHARRPVVLFLPHLWSSMFKCWPPRHVKPLVIPKFCVLLLLLLLLLLLILILKPILLLLLLIIIIILILKPLLLLLLLLVY